MSYLKEFYLHLNFPYFQHAKPNFYDFFIMYFDKIHSQRQITQHPMHNQHLASHAKSFHRE